MEHSVTIFVLGPVDVTVIVFTLAMPEAELIYDKDLVQATVFSGVFGRYAEVRIGIKGKLKSVTSPVLAFWLLGVTVQNEPFALFADFFLQKPLTLI